MTSSSHYNDLSDFLTKHNYGSRFPNKNIQNPSPTHTRIASVELKIYGGAYYIEKEELPIFRKLYYEHVFVKNRKEYLTERQLNGNGPIAIYFDFRYEYNVTKRIHTTEHIQDMVELYF